MRIQLLALIGFCLTITPCITAQKIDSSFFQAKELMLTEAFHNIMNTQGAQRKTAEKTFLDSLTAILKTEDSFHFKFDSLKQIGRIVSADEKLVIFTWNIPHGMFHNYYGLIQYYSKKEKKVLVYHLKEEKGKIKKFPQSQADISAWVGALYYKIVTTKYKGQVYYTLIGFNFNDMLSNVKLIEVLAFDKYNYPYFPQHKFLYMGKPQNRIIFEYAEQANVSVDYHEKKEMIVFDHLSPARPSLEGQRQFYGPDFSYDGLLFDDGIWMHRSDIDIRN